MGFNASVRTKLLLSALLSIAFILLISGIGLVSLRSVSKQSNRIASENIPVMQACFQSMLALEQGVAYLNNILLIDSFEDNYKIKPLEGGYQESLINFDMYMSAVLLGSESEEFRQSSGGINDIMWEKSGNKGKMVIRKADEEFGAIARKAMDKYADFVTNSKEVLQDQKKLLRLQYMGDKKGAAEILAEKQGSIDRYLVNQKEAEDALKELIAHVNQETEKSVMSIRGTQAGSMATFIIICIISVVLSLGASIVFTTIFIDRPVNGFIAGLVEGSEKMSSAVEAISKSGQEAARGASQQAASVEEIQSSLEEITAMTESNNENMKKLAAMIAGAHSSAEAGGRRMAEMNEAISRIKTSSVKSEKIIKTIEEIAFQTNLLALNAAVEAARAGEAGRGFAVVAEEVRSLARRASESVKESGAYLQESRKNAEDGVAKVREVTDNLNSISENVKHSNQIVSEVAISGDEQIKGIEQINAAMSGISEVAQLNASISEETSSATEELSGQSKSLDRIVLDLETMIKGRQRTA